MAQKIKTSKKSIQVDWKKPPTNFTYMLFERVEPAQNANRYYYLGYMPTLMHKQAVVRMYGRIGQSQRMITPQPFGSLDEAWPLMRSLIRTRLRHGYRVVQPDKYCD
jgi:predicted DNA-binding WGR domain protein